MHHVKDTVSKWILNGYFWLDCVFFLFLRLLVSVLQYIIVKRKRELEWIEVV